VRQGLIEDLRSHGVLSVFHYIPLHRSPMGIEFGGHPGQCPNAERIGDCLLRLPFYNDLTMSEQQEVVDAVRWFECPDSVRR
jgi:dTDP-4-amino-4,6-dideoxygalactose transaminase